MNKVNIGVVGGGNHGISSHFPSLVELNDINLVAVCDTNNEMLTHVSAKFNIPWTFSDYRQMLKEVDLDAVFIIVRPTAIKDITLYCLSQKKHVFLEKPPGVSLEDTKEMAEIAKKNHCKSMVSFNRRFMPVISGAKRIVEKEGPILQVTARFYRNIIQEYYGISLLTSNLIHAVDLLCWLGGEAREVLSQAGQFNTAFKNSFNAILKFSNGTLAVLGNNYFAGKTVEEYEIHGNNISAFIEAPDSAHIYWKDNEKSITIKGSELVGGEEPYKLGGAFYETRHFMECIKNNKEPSPDLEDSIKTMELLKMIQHGRESKDK